MIKSVLQVIPLHVMSCLKEPKTITLAMEKQIKKFFWGGGQSIFQQSPLDKLGFAMPV